MNTEKSKPTAPGNLVLSIPLKLTVVLSLAVVVFTIVYALLPNSRPTLTFLGIAAAGAGAALSAYAIWRGLGITIEQREIQIAEQKVYRALEFLKRWNDPNLAPVRAKWRLILDEVEHKADSTYRIIEDDPDKRSTTVDVLNFFEEMGYSVRVQLADGKVVKAVFRTVIERYFTIVYPWISEHRNRRHQPSAWEHFAWLRNDCNTSDS